MYKIKFLKRGIFHHLEQYYIIIKLFLSRSGNKAYLLGSPSHSNMGDQAQTYCIQKWILNNYQNYTVEILPYYPAYSSPYSAIKIFIRAFKKIVKKNDLLFFHSGYHLTDLYAVKDLYCEVIENFPDHKIIIFPQTLNFKDPKELERVSSIFNNHKDVVLLCRDEVSYETAKQYFAGCRLYLYPDVVTSLIGKLKFDNKREGILFCMRNDVESHYNPEQIKELRSRFPNVNTELSDTTIGSKYTSIRKEREKYLMNMLNDFSKYQCTITDRYHGTIFSLIAATPVIVIASADHKLSSGVKWFPQSFNKYVYYARNLDEAYEMAVSVLADNSREYKLPAYFADNYYDILKEKLG